MNREMRMETSEQVTIGRAEKWRLEQFAKEGKRATIILATIKGFFLTHCSMFILWGFISWVNVVVNNGSSETAKNIWDWNMFVVMTEGFTVHMVVVPIVILVEMLFGLLLFKMNTNRESYRR